MKNDFDKIKSRPDQVYNPIKEKLKSGYRALKYLGIVIGAVIIVLIYFFLIKKYQIDL